MTVTSKPSSFSACAWGAATKMGSRRERVRLGHPSLGVDFDDRVDKVVARSVSDIEYIWQLSYRGGFYRGGPALQGDQTTSRSTNYVTESSLAACLERVKAVKALGLDAGVNFHGRVHKPMAKQLAARLAHPPEPLFIEEPLLSENIGGIRAIAARTSWFDTVSPNFAIQEMSLGIHYNVGGRDFTSYLSCTALASRSRSSGFAGLSEGGRGLRQSVRSSRDPGVSFGDGAHG
ncbi:hypothetical protein F4778DRAFT_781318 [Xylariomycetidae sp. FL2044]|nr:hypothetical protein F4778DRAFT_781318 [Xylariomycetidae sp. FL2044]